MKFIYGTKNKSKLSHMKAILSELHIDLQGLSAEMTDVEETGQTVLENAKLKALHYYKQVKRPVFSCDSGLYFDDVLPEDQPGRFIRRVNGKYLNDDEMREHYSGLAKKYGGRLTARYKNAISLVLDEKTIISSSDASLWSVPFYLVEKAHENRKEGFPLDSLSIEISSGKYYDDIQYFSSDSDGLINGFQAFFKKVLTPQVTIEFKDFGQVVLDLYPYHAPDTCRNFIHLINTGYYHNKSICRSVPNRLIQSGDRHLEVDKWTDDTPGYILNGEFNRKGFNNPLTFRRGTLGMAMAAYHKSDYATAGSFFIMTRNEESLDSIVPAFGQVLKGMDTIDKINGLEVHERYGYHAPNQVVDILDIRVETYGIQYGKPNQIDFKVINTAD